MTTLPPMSVAGRLDALRAGFDGFDALVVTTLPNVRYLTGFTGSAGVLVVTADGALLTTDGRYRTQSAEQVEQGGAKVEITIGAMADQRRAALDFAGHVLHIGLEADSVTWSGQRVWADLFTRATLVPTVNAVEALRECTPSYFNHEGEVSRLNVRNSAYGGGPLAFYRILAEWRAEGSLRGLEIMEV